MDVQYLFARYEFRDILPGEAERASEIERLCFSPNEVCSREHMFSGIAAAPEVFLVAIERKSGRMAGFLNGIATNERRFRDQFFTDASLHAPDGETVMILGLDVLPDTACKVLGTRCSPSTHAGSGSADGSGWCSPAMRTW